MAAHQADVSVLFSVPAESLDLPARRARPTADVHAAATERTRGATWRAVDVTGLRVRVAQKRLRDSGTPTRVRVIAGGGPVGRVVWQHPRPGAVASADDVLTLGVAAGTSVRVPDVVLASEAQARAAILSAGLVPGRLDRGSRSASPRSGLVMRTHPRAGSVALAGSRVDYEMLPGEPRERTRSDAYVDYDSASSLDVIEVSPSLIAADGEWSSYIDFDVIDTLIGCSRRPAEGRA